MDPGSLSVLVNTLKIDGEDACHQSSVVKDLYETGGISDATTNILDLLHSFALPDVDRDDDDRVFLGGPITPHLLGESDLSSSPFCIPAPASYHQSDACTPKGSVFDPIAPRPYAFLLYPHCRQCAQEDSPSNVVRSLNFDSSASVLDCAAHQMDAETNISDEEILLQTIYGTLLEEIILMQASGLTVSVGFETPTSAPRLSGIAETCPPAPVKPSKKFRDRDTNLCRKLEF